MFTGIIESLGTVVFVQNFSGQKHLRIKPITMQKDFKLGESIAINGVCLTVDKFGRDWFEVYCSSETLALTNLRNIKIAHLINLERALMLGQRIGGHFVSGHVDTTAIVTKVIASGDSKIMRLEFAKQYSHYLVPKCSVALDGISLTVNKCGNGFLEFNAIPETLKTTTIPHWRAGYVANMEVDLISKHLKSSLNTGFLSSCGFINTL